MTFKHYFITICLSICSVIAAFAQKPLLTNLGFNANLNGAAKPIESPIATIIKDTIDLPFFDDFAYDGPYPSPKLWLDNDVYVNNTFSNKQITRGIATFDHLDSNGAPYNFLTRFTSSYADTLTSQCINLKNRLVGALLQDYLPSDSIYLSFFIQTGGLGDAPESGDSLILQLKNASGNWQTVWFTVGNSFADFKKQYVNLGNNNFLHNAFQFRFINYVKNSGNMNHFHLDYFQINEGRSLKDTLIRDVAFTLNPQSLLANYSVMPYSHFAINPSSQLRNQRNVYFRNNNVQNAVFATFETETIDHNAVRLNLEPFASSQNINILAANSANIAYSGFPINLSNVADSMLISSRYSVISVGNDATEINDYNSMFNNNEIKVNQLFHQYYAYDDGSAEGGFALDYGSLPNGPGFAAMRFVNAKLDTLHGVDIHFNRALEEVGNRPINLIIWQQIANGPGKTDQIIREISTTPKYVNAKNGFARFELDTLILLPAGEFFVGWRQNSPFNINVGWDANYSFQNSTASNPNIFYNLLDEWEPLPSQGFTGVLMMRPLIGTEIKRTVEVKDLSTIPEVIIYPNPSNGRVNLALEKSGSIALFNLHGQKIQELAADDKHQLDIKQKGVYICIITFGKDLSITKKIIIE